VVFIAVVLGRIFPCRLAKLSFKLTKYDNIARYLIYLLPHTFVELDFLL